jgi:hypothetical protein
MVRQGAHHFHAAVGEPRGEVREAGEKQDREVTPVDHVLAARDAGVEILSDAHVWSAFALDEIGALVEGRAVLFAAKHFVIAAGAYERPVPIPGITCMAMTMWWCR